MERDPCGVAIRPCVQCQGLGMKRDYAEVKKWWLKAAVHGSVKAQYNLALMYYKGLGVQQDYTEAKNLLLKPARLGFAKAKEILANIKSKEQCVS